jgi:hypothetical protein
MPTQTHTAAQLARARRVLASLRNETGCTDSELTARRAKVAAMEAEYGLGGHGHASSSASGQTRGPNAPNPEPVEPLAPNLYPLSTKLWRAPPVVWHPKQRPFVRPYGYNYAKPRPTLRQRLSAAWAGLPTFCHAVKAGLAAASAQGANHG